MILPAPSPRLRFRPPDATAAQSIFERYGSDEEVTRFVGWPRHATVEDTLGFVAFSEEHWKTYGYGPLLIEELAGGRLIGSTGLTRDPDGQVSSGYVLAKDSWGHGYATEALLAMVDWAKDLGLTRVRALCHAGHRASRRVLEKAAFLETPAAKSFLLFPNCGTGLPEELCQYEREL